MHENGPLRITIYSVEAEHRFTDLLEKHLIGLWPPGEVQIWHRGKLRPGERVHDTLARRLTEADFVVLLISPDLVATWNKDLSASYDHPDLPRHRILPVYYKLCSWHNLPISSLPHAPFDGQPAIIGAPDEARVHLVCTQIRQLIDRAKALPTTREPRDTTSSSPNTNASPSAKLPSFFELLARDGKTNAFANIQRDHWSLGLTGTSHKLTATDAALMDDLVEKLQLLLNLPSDVKTPTSVARSFAEAASRLQRFAAQSHEPQRAQGRK